MRANRIWPIKVFAASFTRQSARKRDIEGLAIAIKTPMMVSTTSSSTMVKPRVPSRLYFVVVAMVKAPAENFN
jgi:hypothetical protein